MASYNTSSNNLFRNSPVVSTAATYVVLQTDYIIEVSDTTAARTVTLPAPAITGATANKGKIYIIKDTSGAITPSGFAIVVTPAAGTIDGAASASISANFGALTVFSDGVNYFTTASANIPLLLTWASVSAASATMTTNNGYVATNVGLTTLTLPTTASFGSVIEVLGTGAGLFKIAQVAGQTIQFGNQVTTSGTGGSLSSSAIGDAIFLLCTTANSGWYAWKAQGNFLVT